MKRIRFLAAMAGGLALVAVALTADAYTLSAATSTVVAEQVGAYVTAPGTPARLSVLLALAGRRLGPVWPFDATLATAADRYAYVTRAVDTGLGLPEAAVAAPDRSLLFAAYADGTVRSWDPTTGVQHGIGFYTDATVVLLAYDPARRLLASGDDFGQVELWQVGQHGEISPPLLVGLMNHAPSAGDEVRSLGFYAGGSRLAAATADGDLYAWALAWHGPILETNSITVTPPYASDQPEITAASDVIPATPHALARIILAFKGGDVMAVELPGARWPPEALEKPATLLIPRSGTSRHDPHHRPAHLR